MQINNDNPIDDGDDDLFSFESIEETSQYINEVIEIIKNKFNLVEEKIEYLENLRKGFTSYFFVLASEKETLTDEQKVALRDKVHARLSVLLMNLEELRDEVRGDEKISYLRDDYLAEIGRLLTLISEVTGLIQSLLPAPE